MYSKKTFGFILEISGRRIILRMILFSRYVACSGDISTRLCVDSFLTRALARLAMGMQLKDMLSLDCVPERMLLKSFNTEKF
jgi:hypothetical protein